MNSMKKIKLTDNRIIDVPACTGCTMVELNRAGQLPMAPIWSGKYCWALQDLETPMPGFYVISPYRHIFSITDLSPDEYDEYNQLILMTRRGLGDVLGIRRAHIYQEEKPSSHLHTWILPIWDANESIRISKNNINDYMARYTTDTHGRKMIQCADLMRAYLIKNMAR